MTRRTRGAASEIGLGAMSNARAAGRGLRSRAVGETARDTLARWEPQPAERGAKPRAGLSAERERDVLAASKAR